MIASWSAVGVRAPASSPATTGRQLVVPQRGERPDHPLARVGQHDGEARVGVVGHRPRHELEDDDPLAAALDHRPPCEVELAALDQRRVGARSSGRRSSSASRCVEPVSSSPSTRWRTRTGSGPIASTHASSAQMRGSSSPLLSVAPRAQTRSSRIAGLYGGVRPQVERRGRLDVVVPDARERARPVAQLADDERRHVRAQLQHLDGAARPAEAVRGPVGRQAEVRHRRRPRTGCGRTRAAPRSSPRGARR